MGEHLSAVAPPGERYLELANLLSHEFGGPLAVLGGYLDMLRCGDLGPAGILMEDELIAVQARLAALRSVAEEVMRSILASSAEASGTLTGAVEGPVDELLSGGRELSARFATWTLRPLAAAERQAVLVCSAKAVQLTCLAEQLGFARHLLPANAPLFLEPVDLGRWARALVHGIAAAVTGGGHRLVLVSNSRPAFVRLDGRSLELAVLHLVDNAQKFAPEGTAISVVVRRGARRGSVHVQDEGPGLPSDLQIRPFGRVDIPSRLQVPGIGLGLSIASHVARLHGGRLRHHGAETGIGSDVSLELPLAPEDD